MPGSPVRFCQVVIKPVYHRGMSTGGLLSDFFSPVYFETALKNGWLMPVRRTEAMEPAATASNLECIAIKNHE